MSDVPSLTDLIHKAVEGDEGALRLVFDATYAELRRLAQARLTHGSRGIFLDTTSLVHESYLRFANAGELRIEDRQHFLRYAGHVMRSVIVDFIRQRMSERRGGGALHVTLTTRGGRSRIQWGERDPASADSSECCRGRGQQPRTRDG